MINDSSSHVLNSGALCPVLYLESAEDGSHSAVQGVPAPVAFVDHGFELAGSVSAVLPGQTAVLVVDQLQLGQPLMNLPLETLTSNNKGLWIQMLYSIV